MAGAGVVCRDGRTQQEPARSTRPHYTRARVWRVPVVQVLGSWSFIWLVSASVAFFVGWATPEGAQPP